MFTLRLATSATWEDVALAFIAALPGIIAAVSSIQNGRELKRQRPRNLGAAVAEQLRRPKIRR